jgi:hypothetical protein
MPAGLRTFSSKLPDFLWGSHSLLLSGYRGGGGKGPQPEVDHTTPSNVEVKNEWSYTSALPICLQGMGRAALPYHARGTKYFFFCGAATQRGSWPPHS